MTDSGWNPFKRLKGHHSGPRPFIICQAHPRSLEGLLILMSNKRSSARIIRLAGPVPGGQPPKSIDLFQPRPCFQTLRCVYTSVCISENVINVIVSFPRKWNAPLQTCLPHSPGLVGCSIPWGPCPTVPMVADMSQPHPACTASCVSVQTFPVCAFILEHGITLCLLFLIWMDGQI